MIFAFLFSCFIQVNLNVMRRIKILLCLLPALAIAVPALAQTQLYSVQINPLSRATLYFKNRPTYETGLSNEKTRIIIDIPGCSVVDSARTKSSSGIIQDVYAMINKNNVQISVSLRDKRGYTTAYLPYSSALMVDVFSWNNITPAEDSYRTGLLGLEDSIYDRAKGDLTRAVMQGNADAAAILGIELLKEGKINSAEKNLAFAEIAKSAIPDLYAALSQIAKIRGNNSKYSLCSGKFHDLTGLQARDIQIADIIEKDTICLEPVAHLKALTDSINSLSPAIGAKDSANAALSKKLLHDDSGKNSTGHTLLPEWVKFLGYGLFAVLLLVLYYYMKWRSSRLELLSRAGAQQAKSGPSRKSPPAGKKTKEAAKSNRMALEAYKKRGAILDTVIKDEPQNAAMPKPPKATKPQAESEQKNRADIEALLQSLRTEAAAKKAKHEQAKEPELPARDETKRKPASAKLEMAMHMAEEQQKIKTAGISRLLSEKEMLSGSETTELAQKLGVEKGTIETKKSLETFASDSKKLADLAEKFKSK